MDDSVYSLILQHVPTGWTHMEWRGVENKSVRCGPAVFAPSLELQVCDPLDRKILLLVDWGEVTKLTWKLPPGRTRNSTLWPSGAIFVTEWESEMHFPYVTLKSGEVSSIGVTPAWPWHCSMITLIELIESQTVLQGSKYIGIELQLTLAKKKAEYFKFIFLLNELVDKLHKTALFPASEVRRGFYRHDINLFPLSLNLLFLPLLLTRQDYNYRLSFLLEKFRYKLCDSFSPDWQILP